MKAKKAPIGIIDGGVEGINIFEKLVCSYPNERFIYINDLNNYPYEGKEDELILSCVTKNIQRLLAYQVRLIIVVNNSIIEYCDEYLKSLPIPVIKITDVIIDYINSNFEHKNVLLLAKQYLIKANLYQKNIKYNHLYSIASDELESIILSNQTKTAMSFAKLRELLSQSNSKDVNILVMIDAYLSNLRIEFNEYISCNEIINLPAIFVKALEKYENEEKCHGKNIIISDLKNKKIFSMYAYWLELKYKYLRKDKLKDLPTLEKKVEEPVKDINLVNKISLDIKDKKVEDNNKNDKQN